MNKTELIHQVTEQVHLSKKDVTEVIDTVLQTITEALRNGETIQLVGFGSFEVRSRAARKGRNPKTGEVIQIEASKVPAFKPGKLLKEGVKA